MTSCTSLRVRYSTRNVFSRTFALFFEPSRGVGTIPMVSNRKAKREEAGVERKSDVGGSLSEDQRDGTREGITAGSTPPRPASGSASLRIAPSAAPSATLPLASPDGAAAPPSPRPARLVRLVWTVWTSDVLRRSIGTNIGTVRVYKDISSGEE